MTQTQPLGQGVGEGVPWESRSVLRYSVVVQRRWCGRGVCIVDLEIIGLTAVVVEVTDQCSPKLCILRLDSACHRTREQ